MDFIENLTFYKLEDVPNVDCMGSAKSKLLRGVGGTLTDREVLAWESGV
jgi:hypothetical protein